MDTQRRRPHRDDSYVYARLRDFASAQSYGGLASEFDRDRRPQNSFIALTREGFLPDASPLRFPILSTGSVRAAARVHGFTREWARNWRGREGAHRVSPIIPKELCTLKIKNHWRRGFMRENGRMGVEVCRTYCYPSANRKLWGLGAQFHFLRNVRHNRRSRGWRRGMAWSSPHPRRFWWVYPGGPWAPCDSCPGCSRCAISGRSRSWGWVRPAADSLALSRRYDHVAKFLYRHATHIVVDGEWKRRHLINQGVDESRDAVIRNGVEDDFCPDPNTERLVGAA